MQPRAKYFKKPSSWECITNRLKDVEAGFIPALFRFKFQVNEPEISLPAGLSAGGGQAGNDQCPISNYQSGELIHFNFGH